MGDEEERITSRLGQICDESVLRSKGESEWILSGYLNLRLNLCRTNDQCCHLCILQLW